MRLEDGFFADINKIPSSAILRFKSNGDIFTKFGGGTKKLSDYLTDKKIPLRLRDTLPVLADGNTVFFVAKCGVSNKIRADKNTKTLVQFIYEEK